MTGGAPRRRFFRLRRLVRFAITAVSVLLLLLAVSAAGLWFAARDNVGGRVEGSRLTRASRSPQWREGRFVNRLPRVDGPMLRALREFAVGGSAYRTPSGEIPVEPRHAADYHRPPPSGLRVTWLGHSTLMLEIDGARILIDPVWGERASPFSFLGPQRFFAPPLPLDQLPAVDAVVISHDHYDHLDVPTVRALAQRPVRWIVPLGVGAHLESWGVAAADIVELDWWEDAQAHGVTITATPARHFSGRGLGDANRTLWAGWAFASAAHRVFYSGDTALHEEFEAIGRRLGPFDLTMIEAGAYDAMWADVHLGPEQAVLAHRLVRGNVMLPVHWGLFDLALHGWTEPIERVLVAANRSGVRVVTPRPGGMVEPANAHASPRWWPVVPWETVDEAPAWSSGVDRLRSAGVPALR